MSPIMCLGFDISEVLNTRDRIFKDYLSDGYKTFNPEPWTDHFISHSTFWQVYVNYFCVFPTDDRLRPNSPGLLQPFRGYTLW